MRCERGARPRSSRWRGIEVNALQDVGDRPRASLHRHDDLLDGRRGDRPDAGLLHGQQAVAAGSERTRAPRRSDFSIVRIVHNPYVVWAPTIT